jgi:transposase InsO family protein
VDGRQGVLGGRGVPADRVQVGGALPRAGEEGLATARPGPLEPSTGLPILTDNGTPYRPGPFAACLAEHGITYKRTRPYTLRTNGKAEAMVGHLLRGWAYRRP